MLNTVLITSKKVDSEQLEQLSRNRLNVKVLYSFGGVCGAEELALVNDLSWPELIVIDDDLFAEFSAIFDLPTEPLSKYVYVTLNSPSPDRSNPAPQGNVLFVACNDTHVRMLLPIATQVPNRLFVVIRGENAEKYLDEFDEPYLRLQLDLFQNTRYQSVLQEKFEELGTTVIVLGNDWVGENWRICHLAKRSGIPTVCIQEGPQDFELEGGWQRQMQHADYVFSQGLITLQYLDARHHVVTGCPRLSDYRPVPLPTQPTVLINSNFTYNVFEEARDNWIADCVDACRQLGVDYFISQHPRDTGNLSGYTVIRSDAFRLPDQLTKCNVVITRFSQVLHEAMLMGRQVIYYNPHGEVKKTHTEDVTGGFLHARDSVSLAEQLAIAILPDFPNKAERDKCNHLHCGPCDHQESQRIVQALGYIESWHQQSITHSVQTSGAVREDKAAPSMRALASSIDSVIKPNKSKQAFAVYDFCFKELRERHLNIVEIGTVNAGSLLLLAKFFSASKILGICLSQPQTDLYFHLDTPDSTENVDVAVGSPTDRQYMDRALDAHFGTKKLDIIIDNASHVYADTRITFDHLFNTRLRTGGFYVVEGWGSGYWPKWVDGNPDGTHGLPRFVKEMVDETAMADRTKLWKGERALPVEDARESTIQHMFVASGILVISRA